MGAVNVRLPASCVGAASVRVVPPSTTSTSAIQRIISTLLFATGFSNGRKSKESLRNKPSCERNNFWGTCKITPGSVVSLSLRVLPSTIHARIIVRWLQRKHTRAYSKDQYYCNYSQYSHQSSKNHFRAHFENERACAATACIGVYRVRAAVLRRHKRANCVHQKRLRDE